MRQSWFNSQLSILYFEFFTLNSQFSILNSQFSILNSLLSILNSLLSILNSVLCTFNFQLVLPVCGVCMWGVCVPSICVCVVLLFVFLCVLMYVLSFESTKEKVDIFQGVISENNTKLFKGLLRRRQLYAMFHSFCAF